MHVHMHLCLYIHPQPTNPLSLFLSPCGRCACTGTASRAQRGSGGDSERNVRWFCWSRNSSGPTKEPAQTAAAAARRREDCNPPWWVHKSPQTTAAQTVHRPSDACYTQKWQELEKDWMASCSQIWGALAFISLVGVKVYLKSSWHEKSNLSWSFGI